MKTLLAIIGAVIIFIAGLIGYQVRNQVPNQLGGIGGNAIDLIGTKTGTSTVGIGFSITSTGGQSATTTYPYHIGGDIDEVVFTNKIKTASTTANLQFSFLGSNDPVCNTSTTSPDVGNPILMQDINWFDIGDHLKDKVHSTSVSTGTSTQVWTNPATASGRVFILEDLDYECVALQVSGSSTVLWTQIKPKQN